MTFNAPLLFASLTLCLGASLLSSLADAAEGGKVYQSGKSFDELTPAENTAAKAAAKTKKLEVLRACADPGNMPLSNIKGEGFENKIVEVLAKAMDTRVSYFYRPYLERGLTRDTFENDECDILLDMPADYEGLLTTVPIYRTYLRSRLPRRCRLHHQGFRRSQAPQASPRHLPAFRHQGRSRQSRHHGEREDPRHQP